MFSGAEHDHRHGGQLASQRQQLSVTLLPKQREVQQHGIQRLVIIGQPHQGGERTRFLAGEAPIPGGELFQHATQRVSEKRLLIGDQHPAQGNTPCQRW